MSDRWRHLLSEVWRFIAVAQLATFVALVLFNLAVHGLWVAPPVLQDYPIPAYVIANSVGMVVSYHGSRWWVFAHRPPTQADGGWTAYVVINLFAMVFPVGCLLFSRSVLHLDDAVSDNIAANVIGLVLASAVRFYLFRRFVFRRPVTPVGASAGGTTT